MNTKGLVYYYEDREWRRGNGTPNAIGLLTVLRDAFESQQRGYTPNITQALAEYAVNHLQGVRIKHVAEVKSVPGVVY